MEVRIYPNASRPGVGLKPRRESQRPMLPQHARHCPVLEAGSGIGFLVFPPLEPHESYQVEYVGDGQYKFTFFLGAAGNQWQPLFTMSVALPVGSIGMTKADVEFHVPQPPITRDEALDMAKAFIVPEDLGTPPGGVTLRGATNFATPAGWDAIYTPIFNMIERPIAPMLVVRVETDWFPHNSEFRYVLSAGEVIGGMHSMPIGQVLFVPREDVTLRECTDEEIAAIKASKDEFMRGKSAEKLTTRYGLQYSPHYARRQRERS